MSKETFDLMKKEGIYIGILFLAVLIIFKVIYFNENLVILLRFVLSLFWMFALPGYFLMLYWKEKLDFAERFVIGIALSAAIIGISSYYIGLMGLNIKYHGILLPILMILVGIGVNVRKNQ